MPQSLRRGKIRKKDDSIYVHASKFGVKYYVSRIYCQIYMNMCEKKWDRRCKFVSKRVYGYYS